MSRSRMVKAIAIAAMASCALLISACTLNRPPGWSDAQWYTWLSQYGDYEIQDVPTAIAAGNTSPKTISNERNRKERADPRYAQPKLSVLNFKLKTEWAFKNGQVTKMYPANAHCTATSFGLSRGWHCSNPDGTKVRANCYGGSPEHCAWTYSFDIYREIWVPVIGTIWRVQEDRWCLTNQVSGSGAHYRHGSCDRKAWGS